MNSMRNIQSTTLVLLLLLSLMLALMAEARNPMPKKEKATTYIVDVIRSIDDNLRTVDLEKANIRVLVPVLGSEKAAKKAIIYHFKLRGFAAKLTPSQVKHLKKQPSVIGVFAVSY